MDFFTKRSIGPPERHLEQFFRSARPDSKEFVTRDFFHPGIRGRCVLCHDEPVGAVDGSNGPRVTRVIGVYNAEGTLMGELQYLWRRTFSGEHCALCDITHGSLRRRPDWDRCASAFSERRGLAISLFHLDDAPVAVTGHFDFAAPSVFFETSDGNVVRVMGPEDLATCDHSPEALFAALDRALDLRS